MWESDLRDAGRKVNLICKYREWLMFRVDGSVTSRRWTRKWRRKSVITKFQFPRNYFHDLSADWEQTEWNKARLLSINHHHNFGLLTKKSPLHAHLDWDKFSVQLSVITTVARKNCRLPWHCFTTLCALNTSHHATNSHKSAIQNRAASRGRSFCKYSLRVFNGSTSHSLQQVSPLHLSSSEFPDKFQLRYRAQRQHKSSPPWQ